MIALAGGWLAKSVLMQSPIGRLLKSVPAKVWLWLAIAAVAAFVIWRLLVWHGDKVQQLKDESYAAGRQSLAADMVALRDRLESESATAVAQMRSKNDAKKRDIERSADALRVRGPGAATCSDSAFLPAASGGHDDANRAADAAVAGMPDAPRPALIAVPFAGAVDFAGQHDGFRVEALGWREWHRHFVARWEAYKRAADEAAKKAAQP